MRAELDALDPDARLLGICDVLLKEGCSESSIQFLEQDVEKCRERVSKLLLKLEQRKKTRERPEEWSFLLALRRTLCTKLHVDYVPLRAMTMYYGRKTEVLDEHSLVNKVIADEVETPHVACAVLLLLSDALKSNAKLFEKNLVKKGELRHFVLKGEKCGRVGKRRYTGVRRLRMVVGGWFYSGRISTP